MTRCSHWRKLCCLFSLVITVTTTCLFSALLQLSNSPNFRSTNITLLVDDTHFPPEIPSGNNPITTQVCSPSKGPFEWISGERYLAYLPHSGFHNQRIAFENALVLARILNRTLLVPPARLGKDLVSYHKFDDLQHLLIHSGKQALHHCSVALHTRPPSECWGYFDYTHVSWDWLFDLSSIAAEQPLFHREACTYPWLENPPPDADTLRLKDQTAYDFRFVDYTPQLDASAHPRYHIAYPISTLAASSAQLIQLGTLFGSARLHLTKTGNLAARTFIRERLGFANPHLETASTAAVNALGGKDTFLAAHVRLSDGPFRALREQTVRSVWYRLVACALRGTNASASSEDIYELERLLVPTSAVVPPPRVPLVQSVPLAAMRLPRATMVGGRRLICAGKQHVTPELVSLNVPLFVATDVEDGLALAPLRAAFPCTILLRDLSDVPEVRMLDRLVSGEDGVPLAPFLAPLLDAAIMGRAWAVVGTEGSTFSTYVEGLLWRLEHGHQIAQHG